MTTLFFSIIVAVLAIVIAFKVLRAVTRLVLVCSLVVIGIAAVVYFVPSLLTFVR